MQLFVKQNNLKHLVHVLLLRRAMVNFSPSSTLSIYFCFSPHFQTMITIPIFLSRGVHPGSYLEYHWHTLHFLNLDLPCLESCNSYKRKKHYCQHRPSFDMNAICPTHRLYLMVSVDKSVILFQYLILYLTKQDLIFCPHCPPHSLSLIVSLSVTRGVQPGRTI